MDVDEVDARHTHVDVDMIIHVDDEFHLLTISLF